MSMREDTGYLMDIISNKWTVDRVGKGTYWDSDDEDHECYEITTTGCGCCSDTIQTLDREIALKVARTQVEIWQAAVKELEDDDDA